MSEIFTDLHVKRPNSNVFDLSHNHRTTMTMGKLVPVMVQETLPNEDWAISSNMLVRFLPLQAPIMQQVKVDLTHFFVPSRLLYKDFENLIRGPKSKNDTTEYQVPFMNMIQLSDEQRLGKGTLANYLGIPLNPAIVYDAGGTIPISAMPFLAYNKIYHDYYADENLIDQDFEWEPEEGGLILDSAKIKEITELKTSAWQHDYFTSMLPFAQKGEPVPIPVLGSGTVELNPESAGNGQHLVLDTDDLTPNYAPDGIITDGTGQLYGKNGANVQTGVIDPNGTLRTIIDNITTTIKDLRTAEALQKFLEKNARAGNRYFEYLNAVWGQKSPDSRLQRAEYIGSSSYDMSIAEVLQTSETSASSPLGQQAGHAVTVGSTPLSTYHVQEHGYIISIMRVRPKTAYFQGLHKMFQRFERFDFPLPDFAHIGEQEVKAYELYFQEDGSGNLYINNDVGYLPRYAEMKYNNDRISGYFADDFKYWHQAREFENPPLLNQQFIECDPTTRIFPIEDPQLLGDYILANISFNLKVARCLPRFDIPQLT